MARKKKEIKLDNFYTIRNWMPIDLGLGGTKLLVYAYLYAYSTGENSKGYYFGGQEIISKATGCTKRQIMRVLDGLKSDGLIDIKKCKLNNGLERCYYRIKTEPLKDIESNDIEDALRTMEITSTAWNNLEYFERGIDTEVEGSKEECKRVY